MSSIGQSSWLCSLHTSKAIQPSKNVAFLYPNNTKIITFKPHKHSIFAVSNSKDESSSSFSSSNEAEQTLNESKSDRVKLALEKARKYKKSLQLDKDGESNKDPIAESADIAIEKDSDYHKNTGIVGNGKTNVANEQFTDNGDGGREVAPEAVRLAMEKVIEFEKSEGKVGDNKRNEEVEQSQGDGRGGDMEVSEAIRIAMGKAEEYKENNGTIDSSSSIFDNSKLTDTEGGSASKLGNASIDQNNENRDGLKLSSIDFAGLNFADKKKGRGLPAGLAPVADPYPVDELPEVEILVGDASKFGNAAISESETPSQEESSDLYKPKVSTWGMFPRPSNISETFGGGRTIRPGEALETPEDRASKEARSRQLISAYKRKMGLNMDPKLKAECEKALNDGDSLMDVGRLKEALPYYQTVMEKLPFETELHGLAALNWSICQDSLTRTEEARVVYEKLQTHPNAEVSKKAKQFVFTFDAMEMLKVRRSTTPPKETGYQSYFEAFVEDEAINTSESPGEEDALNQAVLYIVFVASPILLVLLFIAIKRA